MSSFYDIERTISQAIADLALGITVHEQNENFAPPSTGQWGELTIIPNPVESGFKDGASIGMDENTGIAQISLFDADVGTLGKVLLQLADSIAAGFKHGTIYSAFEDVFIQNTSRSSSRMNGGYFQLDVSISFISYVDR
ncbi:hypothetical protein KAR91_15375 [Candidatus Pacearchaeota archaeon]|nr:hypothetical protein [Candidatus Pacearchaeota archaeon]